MKPTFEFEFDELPLVMIDGFECGFVTGAADIQYGTEGDWSIVGIALQGWKRNPNDGPVWLPNENKWLKPDFPLYGLIQSALEIRKARDIREAVEDQIRADRLASPFNIADHKRELRLVHG